MAQKSIQFGAMLRSIHLNINSEVLDEFRYHFSNSIEKSRRELHSTFENLSDDQFECEQHREEYEDVLGDESWKLDQVKKLGDSLAIVGLYRLVEAQLEGVLKVTFPVMGKGKKDELIRGVAGEIDCPNLAGFNAVNELRLINNCIKHNDSKASKQLADDYPIWVEGQPMEDLGARYDDLKPDVMAYIRSFVTEAYAKTSEFTSSSVSTQGFVRATS